jgi:hypothetical protein
VNTPAAVGGFKISSVTSGTGTVSFGI